MSDPASSTGTESLRSLAGSLGMTGEEYEEVVRILEREPNETELAMYSVMWSEHCSYKSSRVHLGRFPTRAPWVVVGPGENAGVVDLGDGWLAALRIESHNHPSFVEPHQGAATGVGGILRDVFTMGARPIALWDAIRFGSLDDPRNRYLFAGVVGGIAGYGNAVGVPTVGGEVSFDDAYASNPLVNVMALGILRRDQLVLARAGRPGNVAVLLGAATGRDGIGGVSVLASAGFEAAEESKRPSVQVGDPFEEKRLIEACLELYRRDLVVGVQDLGGAGITCAASETAARSGTGIDLDLDRVHRREPGMTPTEVLTSESQERMLAIVRPEDVEKVLALAAEWEVVASPVGTVTETGTLRAFENGRRVAEVPAASLSEGAPRYDRPRRIPADREELWRDPPRLDEPDVPGSLLTLLDHPALGDRSWIYEQYDHMLFLNTVVGPGHDGTLLRVEGTRKGLAVSVDGNGTRCLLDPRRGSARLVYEAALNVAVTGARPLALVDNLNFGNPERPEVMWQFVETVEGIAGACEVLGIPVVGGNVSFYNETEGRDIPPTPVVGLLGLVDPVPEPPPRLDAGGEGMEIWLVGEGPPDDYPGGAYAEVVLGHRGGRPAAPDPEAARRVIALASRLASEAIPVLHDISAGGALIALAEVCIRSRIGARVEVDDWRELFSEAPHRLLAVTDRSGPLRRRVAEHGVPARSLGTLSGETLDLGRWGSVPLGTAARAWREAIPRRLS